MPEQAQADVRSPYAVAPLAVAQAFVLGRAQAEADGDGAGVCPFEAGTVERAAWERGFALPAILREHDRAAKS